MRVSLGRQKAATAQHPCLLQNTHTGKRELHVHFNLSLSRSINNGWICLFSLSYFI